MFYIEKNYRDAFDLEKFIDKYIEECFDKYAYIVGDISSSILRLKGFDTDPKSKSYYAGINNYLELSCSFGCPHYVLRRIKSEKEYALLEKEEKKVDSNSKPLITPIEKENFDKESLVLKSTPKNRSKIIIDIEKINSIPKGSIPKDIIGSSDFEDKQTKTEAKEETATTSYVSASPDFDPSKVANRKNFNSNNNNKKNNSNNKNHKNKNKNKK